MIPGTFVFDGVVREYLLRAPPGWQQALAEALAAGRAGLPLLVALHGGRIGFSLDLTGDLDDPEQFQAEFDFSALGRPAAPGDPRSWQDQCFVLYPYALGSFDRYRESAEDTRLPPYRWGAWNPGWSPNDSPVDDDRFVLALIEHLDRKLSRQYRPEVGDPVTSVFDPLRRFLFGRSNGAMMALRLVATAPGFWAAAFVLSGAIGGSPNGLDPTAGPAVFNDPDPWPFAIPTGAGVSLFAVHGGADEHVPPGRHVNPHRSQLVSDLQPPVPDPEAFAPRYAPIADLIDAYRQLAGLTGSPTVVERPGESKRWTWRRANGVEVVEHRELRKGHFDAYPRFDARFVWDWLRDHPSPGI